jgi:putative oxidoreductase
MYLAPNLLFYAAWPMLAACVVLFLMRELDTLASPGSRR